MHYFKDSSNNTFSVESLDLAETLPEGVVEIELDEMLAIQETRRIPPSQPTPLEQIRALEATHADDQAKLTRQSLLAIALDKACATPAAAGLTRAQVHGDLMTKDNGYAALFNLEAQIAALRAQL